jgi:hypothetical protein
MFPTSGTWTTTATTVKRGAAISITLRSGFSDDHNNSQSLFEEPVQEHGDGKLREPSARLAALLW